MECKSGSVLAVAAAHGVEEFLGVEGYAVFEDEDGVFDVVDVFAGVAGDDDEVGVFAGAMVPMWSARPS